MSGSARIERVKEVGRGGFGVVYFGHYGDRKEVAIKVISGTLSSDAITEANVLKRLSHPNIIRYIDIIRTAHEISLVMEFIEGGNLYRYISGTAPSTNYWKTTRQIMTNVAHGMWYLHKQNVVHADLKSLNVLLRHNYDAVICDFGLAQTITDSKTVLTNSVGGTERWFAPELSLDPPERSSFTSDVWAYGCILLEITSQKHPWVDNYPNSRSLLNALAKRNQASTFESICTSQRAPEKLLALLCRCCTWSKAKRPDFSAIVLDITSITEQDLQLMNHSSQESSLTDESNPKPRPRKRLQDTALLPAASAATNSYDEDSLGSMPTTQSSNQPKTPSTRSPKTQSEPQTPTPVNTDKVFGTFNGRCYYEGPSGAVYYLTAGGKKQYADRSKLTGGS